MEAGRTFRRLQTCREERAAAGTWVVTAEMERNGQILQGEPIGCTLRLQMGSKDTQY